MFQRQKIFSVVVAVAVLAMVAYFASSDNSVVSSAPTAAASSPVGAAKPVATEGVTPSINALIAEKFAKTKECETQRLAKIDALTEEKYSEMLVKDSSPRRAAKRLPPTIEKFKEKNNAAKDRLFAMNEEQFIRRILARFGTCNDKKQPGKNAKKPAADDAAKVEDTSKQ